MAASELRGPHIVVMGAMGVGKTTTGRALADALGWGYVDSDDGVQHVAGMSGRAYAERHGVPALHKLEAEVLVDALGLDTPLVISAAASTIEAVEVRHRLRERALIVRLTLPIEDTIGRQAAGHHRRAMTIDEHTLLTERREPLFESIEDLRLDARGSTDELVDEIRLYLDL